MTNAREAAYLAILAASRGEGFVSDFLEKWQKEQNPLPADYRLACQLAIGTIQMALALDHLAEQLSKQKKLSLKLKEKIILRMSLYQYFFLERIPIYAIADEMQKLAQRYCHRVFSSFLNAILRQLSIKPNVTLPASDKDADLSVRFSYPLFFVQALLSQYSLSQTKEILMAGNQPSKIMVRLRKNLQNITQQGIELFDNPYSPMGILKDTSKISQISSSNDFYIQNITPVVLMSELCQRKIKPNKILDLCASPGGKLLFLHDAFPDAALYGNDVNEEKIHTLQENCDKYGIPAVLSVGDGTQFTSPHKFDLIVLDVPCSNTGVLNKRPEARWRLDHEALSSLETKQLNLIRHAISLLENGGEIWYLTCSILPIENEGLVQKASHELGLQIKWQKTILPNELGYDGGFACALRA